MCLTLIILLFWALEEHLQDVFPSKLPVHQLLAMEEPKKSLFIKCFLKILALLKKLGVISRRFWRHFRLVFGLSAEATDVELGVVAVTHFPPPIHPQPPVYSRYCLLASMPIHVPIDKELPQP
jgi:hypothetical protein